MLLFQKDGVELPDIISDNGNYEIVAKVDGDSATGTARRLFRDSQYDTGTSVDRDNI